MSQKDAYLSYFYQKLKIYKLHITTISEYLNNLHNIDDLIEKGKTWYDFWR